MKKETLYRIGGYAIVLTILSFLSKGLTENWQKVQEYQFTFNYILLFFSFFYFFLLVVSLGLIWGRLLRILEPSIRVPYFQAVKMHLCAWFGKYLPGKAWILAGLIYLGQKHGLSKKKLAIAAAYEVFLTIISAFLFSFLLLSLAWGRSLAGYYLFIPLLAAGGLVFIHPKVLYRLISFVLRRFKKVEVQKVDFLSYGRIAELVSYFFICYVLNGLAFFYFVRSLVYVPFRDIIGISGAFVLASVLGIVAVFAPSGLGVREGVLAVLLQSYFPLSVAILISLAARVWVTVGEIAVLLAVLILSKLKKI